MKLLLVLAMVGLVLGCEEEIKEKLKKFVKGKEFKAVFKKYAPTGLMNSDQMDKFLTDADVSSWCRWPSLVIDHFDTDKDEKLSWDEIYSGFKNADKQEL